MRCWIELSKYASVFFSRFVSIKQTTIWVVNESSVDLLFSYCGPRWFSSGRVNALQLVNDFCSSFASFSRFFPIDTRPEINRSACSLFNEIVWVRVCGVAAVDHENEWNMRECVLGWVCAEENWAVLDWIIKKNYHIFLLRAWQMHHVATAAAANTVCWFTIDPRLLSFNGCAVEWTMPRRYAHFTLHQHCGHATYFILFIHRFLFHSI